MTESPFKDTRCHSHELPPHRITPGPEDDIVIMVYIGPKCILDLGANISSQKL